MLSVIRSVRPCQAISIPTRTRMDADSRSTPVYQVGRASSRWTSQGYNKDGMKLFVSCSTWVFRPIVTDFELQPESAVTISESLVTMPERRRTAQK